MAARCATCALWHRLPDQDAGVCLAINKPANPAQVSLGAHLRTLPTFGCTEHQPAKDPDR